MQVKTKAIVLSSLKYGDTSLIVKAYTASDGLKSYLLKGVYASRKGKLKVAQFQPLTQLEIVAVHKNKGSLERIREAKVIYHYSSIHSDIAKNAITLFLSEILVNSIQEEQPQPELFHFIEHALQWLDTHDECSNFHLYFLLSLTRYLGFYPDTSQAEAPYFDLVEGEFTSLQTLNPKLSDRDLDLFKSILGTNFDALERIRLNKKDRQHLLEAIVQYFELHLHGFRKPRSLSILNQVFS